MVIDGIGDLVRLALRTRVKAADDALEFREFANHFGREIALRQLGGTVGFRDMRLVHPEVEPLLGKPARDIPDALHFVPVAAQAGFVRNALELREIVGEPTFLVGLPKEPGVGKRARRTRSCPSRMMPVVSLPELMTARNCGASSPFFFSTAKYF